MIHLQATADPGLDYELQQTQDFASWNPIAKQAQQGSWTLPKAGTNQFYRAGHPAR